MPLGQATTHRFQTFKVHIATVVALCVETFPNRLDILPIALNPIVSTDEWKRFKRFISISPPKFNGAIEEVVFEFFIDFQERLHNFNLLESCGIAYTFGQLSDMAR